MKYLPLILIAFAAYAREGVILPVDKSGATASIPAPPTQNGTTAIPLRMEVSVRGLGTYSQYTRFLSFGYGGSADFQIRWASATGLACVAGTGGNASVSIVAGLPAHMIVRAQFNPSGANASAAMTANYISCEIFDGSTGERLGGTSNAATTSVPALAAGKILVGHDVALATSGADMTVDWARVSLNSLVAPGTGIDPSEHGTHTDLRFDTATGLTADSSGNGHVIAAWTGPDPDGGGPLTGAEAPSTDTSPSYNPYCSAGSDRGGWRAGKDVITLDGSASRSLNEGTLTYSWSLVSRPANAAPVWETATNIASPKLGGLVFGDYEFGLTVSDEASSTCTVHHGAAVYDANGTVIYPSTVDPLIPKILGPLVADGKNPVAWADYAADKAGEAMGLSYNDPNWSKNRMGYWDDDPAQWGDGTIDVTANQAGCTSGCDLAITCHTPGTCNLQTAMCGAGVTTPPTTYPYMFIRYPVPASSDLGWATVQIASCTDENTVTMTTYSSAGNGRLRPFYLGAARDGTAFTDLVWSPAPSNVRVVGEWEAMVNTSTTFYDPALGHIAQYYRTGLTKHLTWFRWITDRWWSMPLINKGWVFVNASTADFGRTPGSGPKDWSVTGLFVRALEGRPEMWPGLKRLCDFLPTSYYLNDARTVASRTAPGEREYGYALAALSLCAMTYPTDDGGTIRSGYKTALAGKVNGIWKDAQCTGGGASGRDCEGRNGNQWIIDTYSANGPASPNARTSYPSSCTGCAGANTWRANVEPGSHIVTFTGTGFSLPADMSALWLHAVGDTTEAFYMPERIDATTLYLRTYQAAMEGRLCSTDATACRNYDGIYGSVGSPAAVEFQLDWASGTGKRAQPFMMGIIMRAFDFACKADPTGSAAACQYLQDLADWTRKYGYFASHKGLYYLRNNGACEPRQDYPVAPTEYIAAGRGEDGIECAYTDPSESRSMQGEIIGGIAAAYAANPTQQMKDFIDTLYAAVYGGKEGYACTGDFAAICPADGAYHKAIESTYTSGTWYHHGKYFGFAFGFGGGFAWPAARVGGVQSETRTYKVGARIADVPNATKIRVTVTPPDGVGDAVTATCTSSPCSLTLDRHWGGALAKIEYLSVADAVLAAGTPQRITLD